MHCSTTRPHEHFVRGRDDDAADAEQGSGEMACVSSLLWAQQVLIHAAPLTGGVLLLLRCDTALVGEGCMHVHTQQHHHHASLDG